MKRLKVLIHGYPTHPVAVVVDGNVRHIVTREAYRAAFPEVHDDTGLPMKTYYGAGSTTSAVLRKLKIQCSNSEHSNDPKRS
jgi:hypothetical protein